MGEARGTNGVEEKVLEEGKEYEDRGIDIRIILKWILNGVCGRGLNSCGSLLRSNDRVIWPCPSRSY